VSLNVDQLLSMLIFLSVFVGLCSAALAVSYWWGGDRLRAVARLRELSTTAPEEAAKPGLALVALPKVGALLTPMAGTGQERLKLRLLQAGLYGPQAVQCFRGAMLLCAVILPALLAGVPALLGVLPARLLVWVGLAGFGLGLIIPGMWVDHHKRKRQSHFRNALPDCLDMLVLCVEGGVSLTAALHRVTAEMKIAHPVLGIELEISQREMQLGLSPGETMKKLAERCDVEELRQLSSMLIQSERYGTSVVKALRIHADCCRLERYQNAEEMAQKAAVKILFPTLLCIFPAIFVVVLGPAAHQIATMFSGK
jgi:tight adherence protein C